MLFLRCDDFYNIPVFELVSDGNHFSVYLATHTFLTYFRVYTIGKIHYCSPFGECFYISFRCKDIDFIGKEIHLDRL